MPLILRSSLEHRIVEYASEHYPVTAGEIALALRVSGEKVMMELRRMESKGLVELDILPDKVYVRVLVMGGRGPAKEGEKGRGGGGEGRKVSKEAEKKKKGGGGEDPAYL